jgi:hypothetical protein
VDLQTLQASNLTQLVYWANTIGYWSKLESRDISLISSFNALKRLELFTWYCWDDLTPLGGLRLDEFGCASICMLFDILAPGSLHTLKSITFPTILSRCPDNWLIRREVSMVTVLSEVATALVKLPLLATLEARAIVMKLIGGSGLQSK